jgi:TPR repeat protein
MSGKLKIGLGVLAVLAALYVFPFFVPLPERTSEAIIPPFPAEYGAAAIADLEAAETLYREGDLRAAYDLWKPLADAGNPEAQFRIGRLYDRGELFEEDWRLAELYYSSAIKKNHPIAYWNIAANYLQRNPSRCDKLYLVSVHSAAIHGSASAQYNLGVLNWKNRCFQGNVDKAEKFLLMSANQNFRNSHVALVSIYGRSEYSRRSGKRAYFHMLAGSEKKDVIFPIIFYLAWLASTPAEREEATDQFQMWRPVYSVRLPSP